MRALTFIAMLLIAACGPTAPQEVVVAGNTMGTQYSVKLVHIESDASLLQQDIEDSLANIELMMSTYMPDSEISRFNRSMSTDWYTVSPDFCESVEQALQLSELTGGAFDITVAPLVNLWGFGPGRIIDEPPSDEDVAALLQTVGYQNLHADCARPALKKNLPELQLDMSACGKGLAVDHIAGLLDSKGIEHYLIEVGGELRLRGHNTKDEAWAIGIEIPLTAQRRPHTIVHLTDTSLATSGDYRNFFEFGGKLYSHTIDTRTGKPVTHSLASVTVIDDSGYRADALATALLVMGPDEGMALAIEKKLAALFLSRTNSGIDERATPAFERLRSG